MEEAHSIHRLYENTKPFYLRDFSVEGFWCPWGLWNKCP